jgi:hypothetical protein
VKVKVLNLDDKEYTEYFRDEEIRIPARGYIEMSRGEAIKFLSQATPLYLDGSGRCIKPKMLRLEEDPEQHAAVRGQPLKFEAPDGKQFRTQKAFELYLNKFSSAEIEHEPKSIRRKRKPDSTGEVQSGD